MYATQWGMACLRIAPPRADMDYALESEAYSLVREAAQEHPDLTRGTLRFYGSWTMDHPCPESKEGYQPVRMMLLEKLDDAQPMSKLIRESKRKTGKPLPSELLNILSMPTTSFGGGVILYTVRSNHTIILVRKDGTVAIINFQQAILTAHDKFGGDRYSSILRHWPLKACIYGYSWNIIENDRRRAYCNETSWREWVPKAWSDKS